MINGEHDVLRDEGEAYARKLSRAGVPVTQVRYGGTIHHFVFYVPPDHDSWVVGNEPYVSLHILGSEGYATPAA